MSSPKREVRKRSQARVPTGYAAVLADVKQLIAESRHRALATVNRELVCLYWHIGRVIVRQQETANWGDAVVEQLSADLRMEFPNMTGLLRNNLFRMRQFYLACRELDDWLAQSQGNDTLGVAAPNASPSLRGKVATVSRQFDAATPLWEEVATMWRLFRTPQLPELIVSLSWSHHREVIGACHVPEERYFYMAMAVRERWSVRELRKAILANLRDFFLEFGRDLTFVGDEYAITVGNDTFYIDLLFFHRRLQCLLSVDLKIGQFKPEYVGKSQFYCAALDEQIKLLHENPSIGLVLCKTADHAQVSLPLTAAAKKIGVATYQTALPNPKLIRARIEHFAWPRKDAHE